jgi:hypothetical protein
MTKFCSCGNEILLDDEEVYRGTTRDKCVWCLERESQEEEPQTNEEDE